MKEQINKTTETNDKRLEKIGFPCPFCMIAIPVIRLMYGNKEKPKPTSDKNSDNV